MTESERKALSQLDPDKEEFACPLLGCKCLTEKCMWWRYYRNDYESGECIIAIITDSIRDMDTSGIITFEQSYGREMTETEMALQRIAAQAERVSAQLLAEGAGSFEARDGSTALYCPITRKACMRRLCAAAERRELGRLSATIGGCAAEWACTAFGGCVVDRETDEDSGGRDAAGGSQSARLPAV